MHSRLMPQIFERKFKVLLTLFSTEFIGKLNICGQSHYYTVIQRISSRFFIRKSRKLLSEAIIGMQLEAVFLIMEA